MITIGQLARYAGVTIKAVRHYHKVGLLPEPERDHSGYRRYTARDAVGLVKIRALAEAGVPLARVKELLAAGEEEFASSITEIDEALRRREEEIRQARERVVRLRAGDALFVTAEAAVMLDLLRELGVSERGVRMEREVWVLMQAVAPDEAAVWLADKTESLADPEFRRIYLAYDEAFGFAAEDPRLPALARRAAAWLERRPAMPMADPEVTALAMAAAGASSPAWDRMAALSRTP
ncbi:MerR family transcriptional regulator [Lentzea californiensis]|uniref:MerR family transcriptional regulator n=1 Tax=Lentzea californiensis TaxID=438851 RepID=UPI00216507F4|nr:MerR family transcriptional regulator [Lentzea californiensis]MCR3752575.1 DNA-binding transcriptional regulator, MerR family [Lentzea californiensis]